MISDKVKKWIIKALEDIKTIEHEFEFPENEIVTSSVCFHAQQAVEKLFKAFLVTEGIDFGKTHNLNLLLKLCSERDGSFKTLNVGKLSFYAVDVRYPDLFYTPTIEEAKECFEIVRNVTAFIFEKLNIKREEFSM